jgi:hypothetical protein
MFELDEVVLLSPTKIQVHGWALGRTDIFACEFACEEKIVGKFPLNQCRLDVYRAYPSFENLNSGYLGTLTIDNMREDKIELEARLMDEKGAVVERFARSFWLPGANQHAHRSFGDSAKDSHFQRMNSALRRMVSGSRLWRGSE